MNPRSAAVMADIVTLPLDQLHPWLGLASFTEESRAYFYGREDEVAELARRVQRKLLTVLFGQSGLGKTSILRAGLVPRLRAQGYCPVYVRIDYGRDAPPPAEQIKQAILRASGSSGQWTQVGVAVAGESLWEFLHHRDDVLHDESGATLTPLLIFDQFEEIFTLGQTDDFGRERAAQFIEDLANLVENRPPKSLEARLEQDELAAERFDFARSDYRVLIALREDYLAHLEGLKGTMPSITQNRMRLARMTGQQALAAVTGPGGSLVSEEVAAAIVRFVAGGTELVNAEVEPSLLSLICRELNDARIAQGRREISVDLLDGTHAGILRDFYERALADQPAAVRRVIEDELLTESGFRENVAEERLRSSFAAAGATPDALALLVNRRLLRIEERLDVRRVELTHDVLCGVVRASRDLRHEREARDATERLLAEQRERELAARRALVRARQVAGACAVLAIGAVAAALYGYLSTERARRAEREAEETRAVAERARVEAESLLGYLEDDFALELEGVGRLGVVSELGKKEVDYYASLPKALQNDDTARSGAFARLRYGTALAAQSRLSEAEAAFNEAVTALERLRKQGDTSEATTVGLALGLNGQSDVLRSHVDAGSLAIGERAMHLLQPVADAPNASVSARLALGRVATRYGLQQSNSNRSEEAVATLELAKQAFTGIGGFDLSNLSAAAGYAEATAWQVGALGELGRRDEAFHVGAEGDAVAAKLLERRPGHMAALRSRQLIGDFLSQLAVNEMRLREAIALHAVAEAAGTELTRLDPSNSRAWNNLSAGRGGMGQAYLGLGRPRDAVAVFRKAAEAPPRGIAQNDPFVLRNLGFAAGVAASTAAQLGDQAASRASLALAMHYRDMLYGMEPAGSFARVSTDCWINWSPGSVSLAEGDAAAARARFSELLAEEQARAPQGPLEKAERRYCMHRVMERLGFSEYVLGDYAAAEHTARAALDLRREWPMLATDDQRINSGVSIVLAMALARQGHGADAARVVAPVVTFQRSLLPRNRDDQSQHVELASALYAQALADPTHRRELLQEAATLIAALSPDMQRLQPVRQWRDWIADGLRGGATAAPSAADHSADPG
jgi:tetratricopeptide (TPR) repeat protein